MKYKLKKMKTTLSLFGLVSLLEVSGCTFKSEDKIENYKDAYLLHEDLREESLKIEHVNKEEKSQEIYDSNDLKVVFIKENGKESFRFGKEVFGNVEQKEKGTSYGHAFYFVNVPNFYIGEDVFTCSIHDTSLEVRENPDMTGTNHYWIPDSKVTFSYMDASYFPLPQEFINRSSFTKEELAELEKIINDPNYDLYAGLKWSEYPISNLFVVSNGEDVCIYDKEFYTIVNEYPVLEDPNSYREVCYFYEILNPKNGLKCAYDVNLVSKMQLCSLGDFSYIDTLHIEAMTSLDKKIETRNQTFNIIDLSNYLSEEQIKKGSLSYEEIEGICSILKEDFGNKKTPTLHLLNK